jgi:hypothetical protein
MESTHLSKPYEPWLFVKKPMTTVMTMSQTKHVSVPFKCFRLVLSSTWLGVC